MLVNYRESKRYHQKNDIANSHDFATDKFNFSNEQWVIPPSCVQIWLRNVVPFLRASYKWDHWLEKAK